MKSFAPSEYFNLSEVSFADLFEGLEYTWDALRNLEDYIHSQFESGAVKANYLDSKDVFIGEGTVVKPGALIEGPAIIGKHCTIGHTAYIRGGCLLGDMVNVGHASEIKHSILLGGAAAAHFNYVGDSIIGNTVNLAGGVMCANFRLDKKQINVRHFDPTREKERIPTGHAKFGAIVGDGSNVGVHAVLNPGTILGKYVIVYPQLTVSGTYHTGSTLR